MEDNVFQLDNTVCSYQDKNKATTSIDIKNTEIPYFYDQHSWKVGETFRIRIGYIYDPSKFWIVVAERELTLFQQYLNSFYQISGEVYKIPREDVKRNIYCVAYSEGAYYRGLVREISLLASLENQATVFLFDFGYMTVVSVDNLYYLYEKIFKVPQFAVRASLYGVRPYNSDTWTSGTVQRFAELVTEKILLCFLVCTDPSRRVVYVNIGSVDQAVVDIGELLMKEKLAKKVRLWNAKCELKHKRRYFSKTKYPYLFPSFDYIEGGRIPPTVHLAELLKQCSTSIVLYSAYCSYSGSREDC